MAIYKSNVIDVDLDSAMTRSSYNYFVAQADVKADRFGVRIFRSGQPVDLTGVTVVGYFIAPNSTSVPLTGERDGNLCYVDLISACYAYNGAFTLSIKLIGGGVTATVRVIDGTIVNTALGDIVDPGGVIPDWEDFSALVSRAEAAATAIEGIQISRTQIEGTRYRLEVTTA